MRHGDQFMAQWVRPNTVFMEKKLGEGPGAKFL